MESSVGCSEGAEAVAYRGSAAETQTAIIQYSNIIEVFSNFVDEEENSSSLDQHNFPDQNLLSGFKFKEVKAGREV